MNQELKNFLKDLITIYQDKYADSLVGKVNEDGNDVAFREGCNFAYLDALDIIASQIKSFSFIDKDLSDVNFIYSNIENRAADKKNYSIGIDGCKGGWIAASLEGSRLNIERFSSITEIMNDYPDTKSILIDMPVGLQSATAHKRPDTYARQIIRERASTVFPAPCRQAIYAETVSRAYEENERVLGKKFTPLTVGIIPKIREVDLFLQNNSYYKNRVLESHPEVCFAILNGRTLMSKKNEFDGMNERIFILQKYIPTLRVNNISDASKQFKCMMDDIIDAICLAVVGTFMAENKYYSIPPNPMPDDTGLLMQMILPKID